MELLMKDAPINNLLDGDRAKVLLIYDKAKASLLNKKDVCSLYRITQQNCDSFTPFQLSLILRIAEVTSQDDNIQENCEYICGNISGAYGFYY